MEIKQLDTEGRWWRIGGREVDLNSDEILPANVRACILAHRDADDEEGHNVAAILAAQVEAGDTTPLPIVSGWLFAQAQKLVSRIWERIERIEREHAA
jgi:hypothetical protein